MDDSSAGSSPLSSPPSSVTGSTLQLKTSGGKLHFVAVKRTEDGQKASDSTAAAFASKKRKRTPSPAREATLADNPHVAFIVAFRARFGDAFTRTTPNLGPQDVERGISGSQLSDRVELLLCALLGLCLNRKKPVEKGHYHRALEEAISVYKSQWPKAWGGLNPIAGARTFDSLAVEARLGLLRSLTLWTLDGSEVVHSIIKQSYKGNRQADDLNQPLSIQPLGKDSDKRVYYLIEGQDDTCFRIYRSTAHISKQSTWINVAGSIEEARYLAEKLLDERTQNSGRVGNRITATLPRLEAGEERRHRREYRQAKRAAFSRPEPGFSMYEGRTRGRRINYAYSEPEEVGSDDESTATRRSKITAELKREYGVNSTTTRSGRVSKAPDHLQREEKEQDEAEMAIAGSEDGNGDGVDAPHAVRIKKGDFQLEDYESADNESGQDNQDDASGYEDSESAEDADDDEDGKEFSSGPDDLGQPVPPRKLTVALRIPPSKPSMPST